MSGTIKTVLIDGGTPIALADDETRFIYNLLPVGEFYDKRYGRVSITPEKIRQMSENFGKCPAYEVPVKLGHSDGAKSPGRVIGVEAKPEGLEITMLVDSETAQAINAKQYRYMSAEFDEDYSDKTSGEKVGAVLLGAALVNQPANPYVAPLILAEDITPERTDEDMTELEDLRLKLSDTQTQVKELREESTAKTSEADELRKRIEELEAENKALKDERKRAEKLRTEAEVKAFCDKWTGQGIPPAVLEKVKPILLSEQSRVIRLSDDAADDVPSLSFFDELFEGMPKVPMTQISSTEKPAVELSDVERAIAHGKVIAESANR